jgi:hypothetical protein
LERADQAIPERPKPSGAPGPEFLAPTIIRESALGEPRHIVLDRFAASTREHAWWLKVPWLRLKISASWGVGIHSAPPLRPAVRATGQILCAEILEAIERSRP